MRPPKKFAVRAMGGSVKPFRVPGVKRENLEQVLNDEVAEADKKIKTADQLRMDREAAKIAKQFTDEFDSEYWLCLVFQTREQKEAFLKLTGWGEKLDGDKYLSGTRLAKLLGVALPAGPRWRPAPAPKARWAALALPLKKR